MDDFTEGMVGSAGLAQAAQEREISLEERLGHQLAEAHAEVTRLTKLLELLKQNPGTAQILDLMARGRKNTY
jgi:hypothetical protein